MSTYLGDTLIAGVGRHTESNAHNLLDFKWSDHIINSMEWLRSDTFSWQSGSVYTSVYQHLVADISGKTLQTETIGDITVHFYLADDGHKIVPATYFSEVESLFNTTGAAWYYILDINNIRFKLPRVNPNRELLGLTIPVVGNGYGLTLTNGNQVLGLAHDSDSAYTAIGGTNQPYTLIGTETSRHKTQQSKTLGVPTKEMIGGDLSKSGLIADVANGIGIDKGHKYLYFYVGHFSQSATEQTAGITTEQLNQKADKSDVWSKDTIMSWFSPDISAGVSKSFNTDYVADVSGLLVFYGGGKSNNYPYAIINGTNTNFRGGSTERGDNPSNGGNFIPVTKGQTYKIGGSDSYSSIVFYPYKGETS